MNIAFPFVILMSQNDIQRNKNLESGIMEFRPLSQYYGQKLAIFDDSYLKRLHMHNWDTILESWGRLGKTVYSEKSVKVCHSHQL